ncbi:MAG: hypothetical protein P9M12_07365 [Candidatus Aceula lacicola]|nr:hypothetical protein [Candidatus Aceula lacicola]
MTSKQIIVFLILLFSVFFLSKTYAIHSQECGDVQLVVKISDVIVYGEVVKVETKEVKKGQIYTLVNVKADKYIKGEGRSSIVLKLPGGCIEAYCMGVSGIPIFYVGQKGYLYLSKPQSDDYASHEYYRPVCGYGVVKAPLE